MVKNKREERQRKVVSARRRVEQHEVGGGRTSVKLPEGMGFFSVKKAGTYRIDVLPFTAGKGNPFADAGELHYERTYFSHRGIGPNNATYVCSAKTFGKRCPVCEHRMKIDGKADEELIKSLVPKERQLFFVIDHAEKDKGVQCWDQSFHLFGKHLDAKIKNADDDDGYEFFADPEKGYTLKVGATEEKGGGFSWCNCSDIEFKARKDSIPDEVLEECPCLDDCLIEMDYDELKKIFLQIPDEEDPDEDEKPKSKAPAKKSSPPDEDEEDEDEEPEEEEESDDDDEKPANKPVKHSLKKGDEVTYKRMLCEIVKVSPDGTSLTLEDEDGEVHKAVGPDEVKLIEPDEEEDEEPEEEEPEEEEKPAKRKPGRPKKNP